MSGMTREVAHYWRHPALPEVDLLRARYVTYRFGRHIHPGYTLAVIEAGVEEFEHQGTTLRAGPGSIAVVNPEIVHTGQAGIPEGWSYRASYPSVDLVATIAAELGLPRGTPTFRDAVIEDPAGAGLLRIAHRAAEEGDALASSSLMRVALARLLDRHAVRTPAPAARPASPAVRAAREILHERLVAPPTLDELAAAVDLRPLALLRAFRAATGLPPHAYLNHVRVQRARHLLDMGHRPAEVASRTGFADQAHLTRHFKRVIGVPPRAYQRGRSAAGPPR